MTQAIFLIFLSYIFGGINGAYYLAKGFVGKDIRKLGSGNAGARNAGRHLGKKGFLLTVLIDTSKVMVVLFIASYIFQANERTIIVCALFLLLGHILPIHLQFQGGKGVVVFLAVTLYLVPVAILVTGTVMGIGYLLFRRFTLPGVISLLTIPLTAWAIGVNSIYTIGLIIMLLIVLIAHKDNKNRTELSSTQRSVKKWN